MHENAVAWDKANGWDNRWNAPKNAQRWPDGELGLLPENRPCDWCGETVETGFLHKDCKKKEREHWLDILY